MAFPVMTEVLRPSGGIQLGGRQLPKQPKGERVARGELRAVASQTSVSRSGNAGATPNVWTAIFDRSRRTCAGRPVAFDYRAGFSARFKFIVGDLEGI